MEENKKIVKEALKNNNIDCAINTRWSFIGEFLKFLEKKDIIEYSDGKVHAFRKLSATPSGKAEHRFPDRVHLIN